MYKNNLRKRLGTLFVAFVMLFSMFSIFSPTLANAENGDDHGVVHSADQSSDFPITFEDQDLRGITVNSRGGTAMVSLAQGVSRGDGQYSVLVSERTAAAAGPLIPLTPYIEIGTLYRVSVWVKSTHTSNATYAIRVQSSAIDDKSGAIASKFLTITSKSIPSNVWTELTFDFRFGSNDYNGFYIETTSGPNPSFYIDDINFMPVNDSTYQYDPTLPSLKDAYKNFFLLGTIITPTEVKGVRNDLLRHHFNAVTCENLQKPSYMSSGAGVYTFEGSDVVTNIAAEADAALHGHTLVWHSQSAPWLNPAGTTRAQAKANLQEYITNVAGHYAGQTYSWDVVNEAMRDNPSNPTNWKAAIRNNVPWYTAYANGMGEGEDPSDYIYDAFVFARQADPGAKLNYNDFSLNNANKATAVASMVVDLNARYAAEYPDDPRQLIEGVGEQGHYSYTVSIPSIEASFQKFIAAGVEISISELDVTIPGGGPTEANFKIQAQKYAELFLLFKRYAAHIDRITLWGMDDTNNWKPSGYPMLFNEDLSAKEAYWAVLDPEGYLGLPPVDPPFKAQIADLKGTVAGLDIVGGNKNALMVKLNQAEELLSDTKHDKSAQAVVILNAFIGQVNNFVNPGKLTEEQAMEMIEAAKETIWDIAH